jgi:hypothetical protein
VNLQRKGKAVVTVLTNEFEALAKAEREALGAPSHPLVIVPHPIGSLKAGEVRERADGGFAQVLEALVKR